MLSIRVLVTGGAGYIGSHTCLELLKAGFDVVVLDNLSNSCEEPLIRVQKIAACALNFVEGDVRDEEILEKLFARHRFDIVLHFAGLKAVGESGQIPLTYYDANVTGALTLLRTMARHAVKTFVFSSSATVYGNPQALPLVETMPLSASNPYGRTKIIIEDILRDLHLSDAAWSIGLLRYFNPVGAHKSGEIGEDPAGVPNNLVPFITQVASGRLERLKIFGNDYDTPDGTGIRDYIHVQDLARGHVDAIRKLLINGDGGGCHAWNLGVGQGYSVLEMVKAFEEVNGIKIPYDFADRRPGDVAVCYADAALARRELGWRSEYDLRSMLKDAWCWQKKNPVGYCSQP